VKQLRRLLLLEPFETCSAPETSSVWGSCLALRIGTTIPNGDPARRAAKDRPLT
jgi:hypothetical protein